MKWFWITNFVLFQSAWFICAFFTEYAPIALTALLALHFALSPTKRKDLQILPLALVGIVADKLHLMAGTFAIQADFFPLWLALLWAMFVLCLNHSLSWLAHKPTWLVAGFGAIGGPLSYFAGIKAGAMASLTPMPILITSLACSWALLIVVLIYATKQIDNRFLIRTA